MGQSRKNQTKKPNRTMKAIHNGALCDRSICAPANRAKVTGSHAERKRLTREGSAPLRAGFCGLLCAVFAFAFGCASNDATCYGNKILHGARAAMAAMCQADLRARRISLDRTIANLIRQDSSGGSWQDRYATTGG